MNPSEFRAICLARYGYGWQTRLAKELRVNARTVRRWAAGEAEIPPAVLAAIQARPAIALDYPDEWCIGAGAPHNLDSEGFGEFPTEYVVHLRPPRFIGVLYDAEEAQMSNGISLALREETVCEITWIDPPPDESGLVALIRSLQEHIDIESD